MVAMRGRKPPKREPPIQIRPGPDLGRLLGEFAARYKVALNQACKCLVALAVTELDSRFYPLLHQLAEAMGGADAFTRACTHVRAALEGGVRARGEPLLYDPDRATFVVQTVRDFLTARGMELHDHGLSFVRQEERPPQDEASHKNFYRTGEKRTRKIRRVLDVESGPAEAADQEGNQEQAGASASGKEPRPQPTRS
jgi:hypothetical protein